MVLLSIWILSTVSENQLGTPELQGFDSFKGQCFPHSKSFYVEDIHLEQCSHTGVSGTASGTWKKCNVQAPTQIYGFRNSGCGAWQSVSATSPGNFDVLSS